MRLYSKISCLCLIACTGAVAARSIDEMNAEFAAGECVEVAEANALAANSLSVYCHYIAEGDARLALFERAMHMARKAIELDAADLRDHFQLAHAMRRYSQQIGAGRALKEGYAVKVRDAPDTALQLDPDFALAHLSLATWHLELVQKGGLIAMPAVVLPAKKRPRTSRWP